MCSAARTQGSFPTVNKTNAKSERERQSKPKNTKTRTARKKNPMRRERYNKKKRSAATEERERDGGKYNGRGTYTKVHAMMTQRKGKELCFRRERKREERKEGRQSFEETRKPNGKDEKEKCEGGRGRKKREAASIRVNDSLRV